MLLKYYSNTMIQLQIVVECVTSCSFCHITTLVARPLYNLVVYCTQNCQGLNYACLACSLFL